MWTSPHLGKKRGKCILSRAVKWSSIEALWNPSAVHLELEAQVHLAYDYLCDGIDEGPQKRTGMECLFRIASERKHPDAAYWLSHLYCF